LVVVTSIPLIHSKYLLGPGKETTRIMEEHLSMLETMHISIVNIYKRIAHTCPISWENLV